MKVDLVLRHNEFTSFTSYYLEEFWGKFFNISIYDPTKTYNKNRTLFAVWWNNVDRDPWIAEMKQQGYKVVVDNLWERCTFKTDYHWIEHEFSMCWNESLWWRSRGYSDYRPQKNLQYLALLQLRLSKPERDQVVNELENLLPQMLWSYLAKNKTLPNDENDPLQGQRFMHPSWYDSTYASLVVETFQSGPMHISEKTYKPLAYYHPAIILGVPGTLDKLKKYGFETFENLFDESYDLITNLNDRIKIIKSNLSNIQLNNYDNLTIQKIQHNHDLFFDSDLAYRRIEEHIVNPLLNYAET